MKPDPPEILYFAFGSNLDPRRIKHRLGRIPPAVRAQLDGHSLVFNKRADNGGVYANLREEAAGEVWGVVYHCAERDLVELDKHEGAAKGHYRRHSVEVRLETGEKVTAVTYVAGPEFICPEATPSQEYLERLVRGARHHGLGDRWIDQIERAASGKGLNDGRSC